ncbi:hypothetical protein L873DRAFT_1811472, partial [Choiromyces venosus 120613-1]
GAILLGLSGTRRALAIREAQSPFFNTANQSQKSITEDPRKTSRNHKEKKREKKYPNLTTCPY